MPKLTQQLLSTLAGIFGYYALVLDKPHQPRQILFIRKGYEGRD